LNPTFPDQTNNPLVYIVILNWNNAADTLECLKSLHDIDYQPYVPIVVDNGSTDGSVEKIYTAFPSIHQIKLDSNLGYAAGNNVGIKFALEAGADYILVLNNDTIVDRYMLKELVFLAEGEENCGMVGPKMYCFQPQDTIFALGSFINWSKGYTTNRGMFKHVSEIEVPTNPEEVDFIAGCCVLVRRKLLEEVGFLDLEYYLNYEDVDWGTRVKEHGYEVWFNPASVIWHKVSATMGQGSPVNTYYMTRNALLFFWRNAPKQYKWAAVAQILLRTFRTIAAWTLRPKYWNESYRKLRRANLSAVRDFALGNFGQMRN
jgi:GT2 family glycosyltransferase